MSDTLSQLSTERPLKVCIHPYPFWSYEGTRAQLEDENVIPPGIEWPEGTQDRRFEVGRLQYSLRRVRPEGLKGPMRLWTSGDWWRLYCTLINCPDHSALRILKKQRELAEELYRQSAAGRGEQVVLVALAYKASGDKAFQAFKAMFIPQRKKPGRKPGNAAGAAQGAQA